MRKKIKIVNSKRRNAKLNKPVAQRVLGKMYGVTSYLLDNETVVIYKKRTARSYVAQINGEVMHVFKKEFMPKAKRVAEKANVELIVKEYLD